MTDDIRFYNFDLDLMYILPGYISVSVTQEFNGDGALEIVYTDPELRQLITDNRDNIIVSWRGFQGFVTGFKNDDAQNRLLGMSLNGLLHRVVIPAQPETTADVETIARNAVVQYAPWLTLGAVSGFTESDAHSTEKYMQGNDYIKQLMQTDNGGYRITADFKTKKFVFECLKSRTNPLMLSASNLNAYDFEVTYTNKELSYGGWYKKEQEDADPVWTYITLDDAKTGVYKMDTVLEAATEAEARAELAQAVGEYDISAKTKDIYYGTDYQLGDIVRVQKDGITERKLISSVDMRRDSAYSEQPNLAEYEEGENE